MGRDLITRPYGRFYNLAYHLSELGHDVELILFSYFKNENEENCIGCLKISSVSLFPNPFLAIKKIYKKIEGSSPDWIFGFSDTYYGILAEFFASRIGKKSLIDAYDNYESYLPFAKPLHWIWQRSIKRTNLVTCAGPSLEMLFRMHRKKGDINILPMTADQDIFYGQPKDICRQKLGLPQDVKIIGYHGSIYENRDIETLFSAFKLIQNEKKVILILAGKKSKKIRFPDYVTYLGYLSDNEVPYFINSLDVLVVTNKNTNFGNYSYPVKLYEAMSCNIPVIVSKTKSTEWVMRSYPELLTEVNDPELLANNIMKNIDTGHIGYEKSPTWKELAIQLSSDIEA
jgi:glycosyltransferase involved in cell wall biosynthesis